VPEQATLAIDGSPVRSRIVLEGRGVLERTWEGHREATTGIIHTEHDIGEGLTDRGSREPDLHHRGDIVHPGHRHRRASVHHHDRVRVDRRDRRHEFVLTAG